MKSKLILMSLMTILSIATSAEVAYKCHQPFSLFDPEFEQGSELYLDIVIEKNGVELVFGRSFGEDLIPASIEETVKFNFGGDTSTFSAYWGKETLSMVYLGNLNWGAHIEMGENQLDLPMSVEMMCKESIDILEFANRLK
jgi:hypothetical protein